MARLMTLDKYPKMATKALEQLLDCLEGVAVPKAEDREHIIAIYAELQKRDELKNIQDLRLIELDAEKAKKLAQSKANLKAIFGDLSGKQMVTYVAILRDDYEKDYDICPNSFVVTSYVAHPHQNNSWPCDNLERAEFRVMELMYDRIYWKYMYGSTSEEIEEFIEMLGRLAA